MAPRELSEPGDAKGKVSRCDSWSSFVGSWFTSHFVVVVSSAMAASPGGEWRQSFGQYPNSGAPTAIGRAFGAGACRYVEVTYVGDARHRRLR